MKNYILSAVLIFALLLSCGNEKSNEDTVVQETPEALTDSKLDIVSKRYDSNLVDELYEELVDKSAELKRLEDNLTEFEKEFDEKEEKLADFDQKSATYYSAGESMTTAITDSLLRERILKVIKASKSQYEIKTAPLKILVDEMNKGESTINDHHAVLKIVLTLPLIEKYQTESIPDKKEFDALKKKQRDLVKQLDSLTPKY